MGIERIEGCFRDANKAGRKSLAPYFTSGFPDCDTVTEMIRAADALGVTAIEIGIPYSDSIADGPVIQSSFNEALRRGHRVEHAFEMVEAVRATVRCALLGMVSYSIVHRMGLVRFMAHAAKAGFDGVILPDVPLEESAPTVAAAANADLCNIGLVAPTTTPQRRDQIARSSTGFIYQVAVAGTTGERTQSANGLRTNVHALRNVTSIPILVGFGVSTPEQVRTVCDFADGAIVGSAIVRRIAEAVDAGLGRDRVVASVSGFLRELMNEVQAKR